MDLESYYWMNFANSVLYLQNKEVDKMRLLCSSQSEFGISYEIVCIMQMCVCVSAFLFQLILRQYTFRELSAFV